MSWDRVIQDSDEDEPLEGEQLEDTPSSVDPLQAHEPAVQQQHYDGAPAKHAAHNAVNEAPTAADESMFPQFNINFDEFLQSQDRSHAMLSSSQQRREEKWIPSNSEGESGSVGSMMTEIGLAQRRLMDDDLSTAGQRLPSTATQFSMESVYATFQADHGFLPRPGQLKGNSFGNAGPPIETHSNANQSLLSSRQGIYDLTPYSVASMPISFPHDVASFPRFKERENPTSIPTQIIAQQNAYQPDFYSPHDTEPMSSVASARLSELKSDTTGTSLMSAQHSQNSAPDELSLPAAPVPIVTPAPKKRRGRTKKEAIPDSDDDDDELAFSRDHEFRQPSANGAIHPSDSEQTTELNTPISGGVSDETNEEDLEPVVKPRKSEPKELKKKKTKKEKATPAPKSAAEKEDEVIWVDTKPIEAEPLPNETIPETAVPSKDINPTTVDSKAAQTKCKENTPQPIQNDDRLTSQKRGRKRKKPAAETPVPAPEAVETHTSTETPTPKVSVVVNTSPNAVPTSNGNNKHTPEVQKQDQDPQLQPEATSGSNPITNETPQTPQTPSKPAFKPVETPQNQNQNAGKGPGKHSPISARSTVPMRVGLSKRARIAPLLKIVRK
ncbi:hypothetical protein PENANT_c001G00091 [Penicillium antarcticum]|uniref:Uncharacterized protein n=1 Tax=Penicillium antarcticum TaxID=416450 RepID=A0A1V6QNR8_9EURO|nr:uncharacterized protein N7508_010561 [Penicillium antarcticum]KAJ5295740.1 hypothetical protein N7508_010561 [Penicillium antarcticum]OQD90627.1 hypothetical protein PENANT_c001G00091 [Penicillium antarcticum]